MTDSTNRGVRDVTDEEIALYREQGWAKLDNLLTPEDTGLLLSKIQGHMGVDASNTVDTRAEARGLQKSERQMSPMWQLLENPSRQDAWINEWSHSPSMGRLASRLLGSPARFYNDQVMCKLPASGSGGKTPWHQDLPYHPFDRRGRMSIWIALVDCPPERGTLRFFSGSHMLPPLGRYVHRTDGVDLLDDNSWLLDRFEMSPPLHLRAGDATVHDAEIVHSAPENETEEPRWVYSATMFPADALYTGMANRLTDDIGLEVNQPFDHPDFPVLATSAD